MQRSSTVAAEPNRWAALRLAFREKGKRQNMADESDVWAKVDRCVEDARKQLEQASTEEQFQSIGLLCREALISLAQIVYIPSRHPTLDGTLPSETDAKRMLEAYLSVELAGGPNEAARKFAKAALGLANDVQHKRTASYLDAALCTESTVAVVGLIALISGRTTRAATPNIQVEFSYQTLQANYDEHQYELQVAIIAGKQVINNFKLEFEFPDLDSIPPKWIPVGSQLQSSSSLIEIAPKDGAVSFSKDKHLLRISYQSKNVLFPEEKLDIGNSIGLRYRINNNVYHNIEELPSLRWILYADNMMPKQGEVSLSKLNKF